MKRFIMLIIGILFIGGTVNPALSSNGHSADTPLKIGPPSADLVIHLEAASEYEQEVLALQKKINKLIQRLKLYNAKPYLDPKELRRNGIKRTLGNLMNTHAELNEKMAWHQEKANLILQANKAEENASGQPEVVPD